MNSWRAPGGRHRGPVGHRLEPLPARYQVLSPGEAPTDLRESPLQAGDEVAATLIFENAGPVEVVFNVEERSAKAAPNHEGHGK